MSNNNNNNNNNNNIYHICTFGKKKITLSRVGTINHYKGKFHPITCHEGPEGE
jgi:hypothetical protein